MSALNEEQIGILVRKRLGLPPSSVLRFVPLIPAALLRTARRHAADERLRRHVLTDPATTTVALDASGVGSLAALVASPRIILDLVELGEVTHADLSFPLRPLSNSSQGALAGALDNLFAKYWIEGNSIKTRSLDGNLNYLAGPLRLRVPYWMTLAQLPEVCVEAEGVGLIDSLAELLAEEPDGDDRAE